MFSDIPIEPMVIRHLVATILFVYVTTVVTKNVWSSSDTTTLMRRVCVSADTGYSMITSQDWPYLVVTTWLSTCVLSRYELFLLDYSC